MEGRLEGGLEGRLEGGLEGRLEGGLEGRLEGGLEGRLEGGLEGRLEGGGNGRGKFGFLLGEVGTFSELLCFGFMMGLTGGGGRLVSGILTVEEFV